MGSRPCRGIRLAALVRGQSASAASGSQVRWSNALLDGIPAAVVAVEPGSGRVLAANRAARELSGERPASAARAAAWLPGRALPRRRRPPARRGAAARRARRPRRAHARHHVACDTPRGVRTLRVSAETVDGVALVTCEDVTELRAAQLGERLVADDLRSILEGIADAVTAQGPDGSLVYANDAAVRVLGFPSAEALLQRAAERDHGPLGAAHRRRASRSSLMSLPGRQALMGEEPEPMLVQFRERGGRRDALVAHQGQARCARPTATCGSRST